MQRLPQPLAASAEETSAVVQEQADAVRHINAQQENAHEVGERLMQQSARFKLAENGAPTVQGFGQIMGLPRAA